MTLVVTVNGKNSIWMLTDRRLSHPNRAPNDDARKMMFLETSDGVAILGYAGLGATALGTQPTDWMCAALRGRGLTLERSLQVLAEAMRKQFPQHMKRMYGTGGPEHHVIIPAFVNKEARLYSIDLALAPDRMTFQFRHTRFVVGELPDPTVRPPRIGMAGTGGLYLSKDLSWSRALLRLVSASDQKKISPYAVADHLAELNAKVHEKLKDNSVGPNCIVGWRLREGGGAHCSYTGVKRDNSTASVPVISGLWDMNALVKALIPDPSGTAKKMLAGEPLPELDKDEANARLARIPTEPDEKLR